MDKEHLILRPAEYAHQNIDNYSIVDSSNVRGGRRTVSSVYQMYNIPDDKLSENVSIVYVENEDKEYRLVNLSNKSNSSGWVELKYGSDAPAKIEAKGAIKKTTSGDTVTLDLPIALNSGLNTNPLSIKIAQSSSDYLTVNQNGLNFNAAAITFAVSGQIKDIQAQIDAKQDVLNSSNTINIDYYDDSKLKVIINPDSIEKYLIETSKGLDTNIQPALDKKADLINGIVPASQLPSYIDDIRNLTYMEAGEPVGVTGQALGELYYNTSSNTLFEWKSVIPEGETSTVTQWVQVQPSATTIYLYTGSEPYTQWRWVEDPGVLQKINQDLAWTNGVCTNHVVNGSTQEIDLNILKDDLLLTVKDNILQSKPVNEWNIFGQNLTYNEVTGKIDSANTSYTAGDGIAIEDNAIRRKDVATSASAVQNTYTVNFSYPLQTVSNVNSNITLKLPTLDGVFVGPADGETKTVIVQMYNKASSSITVTLPTTLSGATVYNMYSKPNLILMPQQLGELWITATSNTVTIKVFTSYIDITESSYINFPESEDYSFVYDDSKLSTLKVGDTFTFQVQMADEYKVFKGITLTDEQGQPLQFTLNGTYVTIPQVSKQVNIVVDYTKRFTLTLTSTEGGSVTGDGVYDENTTASIVATPAEGYYFYEWSDGNTESARDIIMIYNIQLQAIFDTLKQITFDLENCEVQSEMPAQVPESTVTFTLVPTDSSYNYVEVRIEDAEHNVIPYTEVRNEDNTVTVEFVMPSVDVTVHAAYDQVYNIRVTESSNGEITVNSTAAANEEVFLAFKNNTGYQEIPYLTITNVTTGELINTNMYKDGRVSFIMPASDVTISAVFQPMNIDVTFIANNCAITCGEITVQDTDGTYRIAYNSEISIDVTPNEGYQFIQWADGDTSNPRTAIITSIEPITFEAICSEVIKQYTVTATAINGTVDGSGTYNSGDTCTLTVTANSGYTFKQWDDGNTENPRTFTVTQDIELTATCSQDMTIGETVDLGLPSGTLWANMNVGATAPEAYGNYYAWGETEPKTTYDWSSYKWCNGSSSTLTKYNTSSSYGTVDNKTQLEPADDAARVNWGGSWRMPTDAEWTELRENCTWTRTTRNGINGCEVKSNINGNAIFLPAAGCRRSGGLYDAGYYGYYWSGSLTDINTFDAYSIRLDSSEVSRFGMFRSFGYSIRPVKTPQPNTEIYYTTTDGSTLTVQPSVVFRDDQGTRCSYDSSTMYSEYGKIKFLNDIVAINYNPNSNTTLNLFVDNDYKVKLKSVELPDSLLYFGTSNVQGVSYGPLYGCTSLESIKLSNNLQFIGYGAFSTCTSLESIILPNTITTIKGKAFMGCNSLKSINFPEGLLYIGGNNDYVMQSGAFESCTSLTKIDLPHSILGIGGYSFKGCSNLSTINYNGTIEEWRSVYKGSGWASGTNTSVVHCTDGDVNI